MRVSYAVNLYDKDGDCWDRCILLFIENGNTILRFNSLDELEKFVRSISEVIIPTIKTELEGGATL